MSSFVEDFKEFYRAGRANILVFAREWMRFDGEHNWNLSDQQTELLECVQRETRLPPEKRKRRIAVKAGRGPGKTTTEVIIAFWRAFLDVDALVVVTAPTQNQLRDVWIAEARRVVQKAHPMIQKMVSITNTKITICGRTTWGIWTRSASNPDNFRGYHQKYLTVIIDEASNVQRDIIRVAKASVTNEDSLIIAVGNPSSRESAFFDMFHKPSEAPLWHKRTWDARDAPHVDKENVKRLEIEFGTDNDYYRVEIMGEFPTQEPNAVMSSDDLWACAGVPLLEAAAMRGELQADKAIGIDIARFGSDESVIYRRSGLAVVEQCILTKTEPLSVIERAFVMQTQAGWTDRDTVYIADADGMGQGAMGILRRAGKRLLEFHNAGKPSRSDFANKITEAYFHVAKLARQRKIHIPNDELLVQQLSSRMYALNHKGKLELEPKKQYVKRLEGQSPDRADALAMAFYNSVVARGMAG